MKQVFQILLQMNEYKNLLQYHVLLKMLKKE